MEYDEKTYVALDIGERRIGLAVATVASRIARPETFIDRQEHEDAIAITAEKIDALNPRTVVVGLPRNLNGDETTQTQEVRRFVNDLSQKITVPIVFHDEALSSRRAEEELFSKGQPYSKGDIDALAAALILDDWLVTQKEGQRV